MVMVMVMVMAGKAVMCEKPLALELNAISGLYEKARLMKLPLLCAFNRRFDNTFIKLQQSVAKGQVGDIHMIKITRYWI